VGLLLATISPVADFYIKKRLGNEQRQFKKLMGRQAITLVEDRTSLGIYRFVFVQNLHVRSRPFKNSHLMGELHFGQIVTLVEKNRHWSLVRWRDDENAVSLQGWVFSRYLGKFESGVGAAEQQ
jgi:uncharacterized protein YgiM (DUF1202 family)